MKVKKSFLTFVAGTLLHAGLFAAQVQQTPVEEFIDGQAKSVGALFKGVLWGLDGLRMAACDVAWYANRQGVGYPALIAGCLAANAVYVTHYLVKPASLISAVRFQSDVDRNFFAEQMFGGQRSAGLEVLRAFACYTINPISNIVHTGVSKIGSGIGFGLGWIGSGFSAKEMGVITLATLAAGYSYKNYKRRQERVTRIISQNEPAA